ncbi:envelope stress response membrane protein PspB [Parasphingorhabdus cellanae]|uniref:Envelope stress response membrane protein PspB n=1 Tax=Parasphingorhabdus cellanae TaxID=2806553 RepID=A0ABX7T800_9SPHN|nr:envelope stress response membrane protein PspB [Parasphingorhabdus cellanae]QTD56340.1 envelope stress response membrane protein PspB [Parasphingorhabdus cellanae]
MENILVPIFVVGMLFIGLPWIIFHYVTKWKTAATITNEDEQLLDELHSMARRLDDRMETIERIMAADNPDWRQSALPNASNDPKPTLENFDNLLKKERR